MCNSIFHVIIVSINKLLNKRFLVCIIDKHWKRKQVFVDSVVRMTEMWRDSHRRRTNVSSFRAQQKSSENISKFRLLRCSSSFFHFAHKYKSIRFPCIQLLHIEGETFSKMFEWNEFYRAERARSIHFVRLMISFSVKSCESKRKIPKIVFNWIILW